MATPISQQTNLRTLRLAELSTIIEDINYNFGLLRSHPMFQGIKGDAGTPGIRGSAGTRGSRWLFLYKNEFQEAFPTTNFNALDSTSKWMEWLNKQISNTFTLPKVLNCFSVDEFVTTDVCVLPNTALLEFDSLSNRFVDTGQQINSEAGYVKREELVEEIEKVKKLINEDIEYLGVPSYIKSFQDGVDAANLTTNDYSYLDSVTGQNSQAYEKHRWFAPNSDDTNISKAEIYTLLAGLKEWYHELVQNTIISNNFSSEFIPGPGRMPAMVLLQNDTNSGMLLGPKPALFANPTLDKFGRIFMGEGRSIIANGVARNIGEYGLHLFSNRSGDANNGMESEVFITPATIYLISQLIDIAQDIKVHGTSTLEGYAKFLDNVDILKKLTANALDVSGLTRTGNLQVIGNATVGTLKIGTVEQGSGNKVLIVENGNVKYIDKSTIAPTLGVTVARTQLNISSVASFTEKLTFGTGFASGANLNSLVTWIESMFNYLNGRISVAVDDGIGDVNAIIQSLSNEFHAFQTNTNNRIATLNRDLVTLTNRHASEIQTVQSQLSQMQSRIDDLSNSTTTTIQAIAGLKVGQIIDIYSANGATNLYDPVTLKGKSNAKISVPISVASVTQEVEIDLSDFFYCGGDLAGSAVPNLAGLSTVGVGVIKYQELIDNPNFPVQITGCGLRGTTKIQLATNNMPAHVHTINNGGGGSTGNNGEHTHSGSSLSVASGGSHQHNNSNGMKFVGSTATSPGTEPGGKGEGSRKCLRANDEPYYAAIASGGLHSHTISGNTGSSGSHSHAISAHSHTMESVGGGQPYYTNPVGFACYKFMFVGKTTQDTPDVPTTTIPISQVSGLETRLNAIAGDISSLQTRVGTLETKVGNLESDFSSLQNRVGVVEDGLGNCVKLVPIGNAAQHIKGKLYAPDFEIEAL